MNSGITTDWLKGNAHRLKNVDGTPFQIEGSDAYQPMALEPGTQTKADVQAEKELQKNCDNLLRLRGVESLHFSHRAREHPGWPDLTFCFIDETGKVWPMAIELKTLTGRLSQDQIKTLTALESDGWNVRIVRSLDTFKMILEGLLYCGETLQDIAEGGR